MFRSTLIAAAAILFAVGPVLAQHGHGHGHGGGGHMHGGRGGHFGRGGFGGFGGFYGGWGLGLPLPYGGLYYSSIYPNIGGYGHGGNGNPYPYGMYYTPGLGYLNYYAPPVYSPLVVPPLAGPAVDPLDEGVVAARPVEARPADPKPLALRVSNIESRRRALRFVEAGDALFREQRYHEALQKYKSAAEAAPDVADSYMRQGFALLATARYELAATAFKRGLAVDADWAATPFRLDSIYGDAHISKDTHVENLVHVLLERPADADLIFVLAMFLQYDGDTERAGRFFHKAADIAGKDAPYLRPYLSEVEVGKPAPARDAPAPARPPRAVELPGVDT